MSLIGKKEYLILISNSRFSKGLWVWWDTFPHLNCLISKHKFAVDCMNVLYKFPWVAYRVLWECKPISTMQRTQHFNATCWNTVRLCWEIGARASQTRATSCNIPKCYNKNLTIFKLDLTSCNIVLQGDQTCASSIAFTPKV